MDISKHYKSETFLGGGGGRSSLVNIDQHSTRRGGKVINPIFQERKLRSRERKGRAQCPTAKTENPVSRNSGHRSPSHTPKHTITLTKQGLETSSVAQHPVYPRLSKLPLLCP